MDKKSSVTVYFEFSFFTLYIDLYRPLHTCTITPITKYKCCLYHYSSSYIHTSLKHFPNTSLSTTRSKCKTWQYERVVAKLNRAGGGTGADRFGCVRSRSLWTVGAVCQLLKYWIMPPAGPPPPPSLSLHKSNITDTTDDYVLVQYSGLEGGGGMVEGISYNVQYTVLHLFSGLSARVLTMLSALTSFFSAASALKSLKIGSALKRIFSVYRSLRYFLN